MIEKKCVIVMVLKSNVLLTVFVLMCFLFLLSGSYQVCNFKLQMDQFKLRVVDFLILKYLS